MSEHLSATGAYGQSLAPMMRHPAPQDGRIQRLFSDRVGTMPYSRAVLEPLDAARRLVLDAEQFANLRGDTIELVRLLEERLWRALPVDVVRIDKTRGENNRHRGALGAQPACEAHAIHGPRYLNIAKDDIDMPAGVEDQNRLSGGPRLHDAIAEFDEEVLGDFASVALVIDDEDDRNRPRRPLRVMGTSAFSCQVAPRPAMTCSICGPIMSQISAQTSRAGRPSEPGCRSGPIDWR